MNRYTAEGTFIPTFDADGNQTLIKTSTGIWNVTYNAKNRPVLFTKSDGSVTVECTYDTMGRRATKKVTTNGTLTEHRRFLYRGYLQIACCDLTRAYTPALRYILWAPTQPTATRPLAIQKNGTWYTYGWDLTKNICETYRTDARIDLAYTYTPYGEVSPAHAYDQPLRWSSEYHDTELGLVYYNYRHYNPTMGRWMARDPEHNIATSSLYCYCYNSALSQFDVKGLFYKEVDSNIQIDEIIKDSPPRSQQDEAHSDVLFPIAKCQVKRVANKKYILTVNEKDAVLNPKIYYYKHSIFFVYMQNPKERRDIHGLTLRSHEFMHVNSAIRTWNDFVKIASIYNIEYCSQKCAEYAADIVNKYHDIYGNINYINHYYIDIRNYAMNKVDKERIDSIKERLNKRRLLIAKQYDELDKKLKEFENC